MMPRESSEGRDRPAPPRRPTVTPTGGPLGAFIEDVDLAEDQPPEMVRDVVAAFERHHVIIFRGQSLTAERQLVISRWFGPTYRPPPDLPMLGGSDQPPIVAVSNVAEGGLLGSMAIPAHSDLQYMPVPLRASMLYAVEVPSRGGETSWSNLCMAYDALDEAMRRRIENVRVWSHNPYAGELGAGRFVAGDQKYVDGEVPRFAHPLARLHPPTGARALYVSVLSGGLVGLDGNDPAEADRLLDLLRLHVDQPQFYYEHRWRPGDVVVWDNRCTNHKRAAFDDGERRVLYRAQIAEA